MGFKVNTSGTIVDGKKIFVNHNGVIKPVFYVTGNNNGALVLPHVDFDVIASATIVCGFGYYNRLFSTATGNADTTQTSTNLNVSGNYINFYAYNNRWSTQFRFTMNDAQGAILNQVQLPPGYRIGIGYNLYMNGNGSNNRCSIGSAMWNYNTFIPTSFSYPYSSSATYIEQASVMGTYNNSHTGNAGLISISAESWGGSQTSGYLYINSLGIYNVSGNLVKNIPFTISTAIPTFTVL